MQKKKKKKKIIWFMALIIGLYFICFLDNYIPCVYQMGAIIDYGCSQAIANVGRFSMRNAAAEKKKRQLKWTDGEKKVFCSQFRKSVINMQCKISMSNLFHIYILKRKFNISSEFFFSVFFLTVKEFQIVKRLGEEKKHTQKWTILITCWKFPGIWQKWENWKKN